MIKTVRNLKNVLNLRNKWSNNSKLLYKKYIDSKVPVIPVILKHCNEDNNFLISL